MDNTTTIALSRLTAQSRTIDVIATNIANADTPGFRAERVLFSDWLSKQNGTKAPNGDKSLAYTQDRATYRDQKQGAFRETGNPLDVAIAGNGFFTVGTPNGPRLTRAGSFTIGQNGNIQDMSGNAVLDTNGQPIQVAATDTGIQIAADGTVSSVNGQIAKIGVVTPNDPNQLQAEGGRLFLANTPTTAVAMPHLVQGAVESSNVQPVLEMTRMMDTTRQFELVTQFVQAEAERQQTMIDKLTQRAS
jgi:flagellar basal-body rod protein FlgF